MSWGSRYQWTKDDFLPPGAVWLLQKPVNDKTYVMYHGTTRACADSILASGFRQSADGMLGRGVYLSRNLEKASRYPIDHPKHDRVVIRVVVNVGKVKAINCQNHPKQKTWHDYGYDTAWVPPKCGMVESGLEENCVWDPRRIKIQKVIRPTSTQPICGAFSNMNITICQGSQYLWVDFLPGAAVGRPSDQPQPSTPLDMVHTATCKQHELLSRAVIKVFGRFK